MVINNFRWRPSAPAWLCRSQSKPACIGIYKLNKPLHLDMQHSIPSFLKSIVVLAILSFSLFHDARAQQDVVTTPDVAPVLNSCAMIEDRTERETCSNQGMMEHIMNKLIYPEDAQQAGIEGTVFVQFVIDQRGQISEAKAMKGPEALTKAAVRVVKELPGFVPGMQKGKPVDVEYVLPIRFALPNE